VENGVCWALRSIQPQDLEAQIRGMIGRENDPEYEVQAAHEVLEDAAYQSEKYRRVVTRDRITLEAMQAHAADLNRHHDSHRDVGEEVKVAGIEVAAGITADALRCRG